MLLETSLKEAVKDLFEQGQVYLDDVTHATQLTRLLGGHVELSRNRTHWIVRVREIPEEGGQGIDPRP